MPIRWLRVLVPSLLLSACHPPAAPLTPRPARPTAPWPPPTAIPLVIDTDAANEVDDLYALALALGFPDRLRLEGIVAAHFGERGGADGIERSYADVQAVLARAGMTGKVPVYRGAPRWRPGERSAAPGVDFIIERARAATPAAPLWLVLLGPATDGVLALERDPTIADRLVVFWHGRSEWPVKCRNFNAVNDPLATQAVFRQPWRFVLFDTGAQITMPVEEVERRLVPLGPLGVFLREVRDRNPAWRRPDKGLFDLGDIAVLIDPGVGRWERVNAPEVGWDLRYDFSRDNGAILRISDVDRARCLALLEDSLRRLARDRQGH